LKMCNPYGVKRAKSGNIDQKTHLPQALAVCSMLPASKQLPCLNCQYLLGQNGQATHQCNVPPLNCRTSSETRVF
jgi:hypothetical protein